MSPLFRHLCARLAERDAHEFVLPETRCGYETGPVFSWDLPNPVTDWLTIVFTNDGEVRYSQRIHPEPSQGGFVTSPEQMDELLKGITS